MPAGLFDPPCDGRWRMPRRIGDVILEVEDLHTYCFTRWGLVKAVDGVSFYLREGEALGIVGESGCGKTMTALSLLRLVPRPAARIVKGKIVLEGENLLEKSEREMRAILWRRISMILQDPQSSLNLFFFFFNDPATTEIYTLSLHDALPSCAAPTTRASWCCTTSPSWSWPPAASPASR